METPSLAEQQRAQLYENLMVYFVETACALGGWDSIEGQIFQGQLAVLAGQCQEANVSPEVFRRRARSAVGMAVKA